MYGVSPELRDELVELRRDLHRHPELSWKEERTATRLYDALAIQSPVSLGRFAGTGVVARVRGKDSGAPPVALRGDIDALPIHENTGLDFASENPGVMHACGHDVHAAWTIGAARLLANNPANSDVLIVLQPAEEVGQGAEAILASGALDGVRAIFGAHVDRRFEVGSVVAQEGPVAASADSWQIILTGQASHAARPHESADPVVGAGALIGALQTIVSRRLNPATPGVVTVGQIHSGTAPNIIPGEAVLQGTLRAVEADTRRLLWDELNRMTQSVAETYRLKAEVTLLNGAPPIVNPSGPTAWARAAVANVLGGDALKPLGFLNMGGEDFAFYLERVPGCFLRIGAREQGGETIPAHSPKFFAAEESILVGAAVLAECARVASREDSLVQS